MSREQEVMDRILNRPTSLRKSKAYQRWNEIAQAIADKDPVIVLGKVFELMDKFGSFGTQTHANYNQEVISLIVQERGWGKRV